MSATAMPQDVRLGAPDPLEPEPHEVESYVAALQALAAEEPALAAREASVQIRLAGARAGRRRAEAGESLQRIFRRGTPPTPAGEHKGILIMPHSLAAADAAARVLLSAWGPWLGKSFDPEAGTGENLLPASARPVARALWPSYRPREAGDGRIAGFRFSTLAGPGSLDPDLRVLKLDYDLPENPRLGVRSVLDELVQVVPGVYLGKALLRARGTPRMAGWFALRGPEPAR